MEDTGVPGETHRPVASQWQTLSHNAVLSLIVRTLFSFIKLTNLKQLQNLKRLNLNVNQ